MKVFFLLLLVVLLWNNNNALRCVNYQKEVSFNTSQLTETKELINKLDTAEGSKVCSIQYAVIYPQKEFVVFFGPDVSKFPGDINTDVLLHIELTMASNGTIKDLASGLKVFGFKCNDEDACEQHFWLNHIDWFVEEESNNLEAAFRLILITKIHEKGKIDLLTTNREISG
jgi:hypothetical protein